MNKAFLGNPCNTVLTAQFWSSSRASKQKAIPEKKKRIKKNIKLQKRQSQWYTDFHRGLHFIRCIDNNQGSADVFQKPLIPIILHLPPSSVVCRITQIRIIIIFYSATKQYYKPLMTLETLQLVHSLLKWLIPSRTRRCSELFWYQICL